MAKKKKFINKFQSESAIIVQPKIEKIQLHEMYKWEEIFLSKKGKKESLKGFG